MTNMGGGEIACDWSGILGTKIDKHFAYADGPATSLYHIGTIGRDTGSGGGCDGIYIFDINHTAYKTLGVAIACYHDWYQWFVPQEGDDSRFIIVIPKFII